MSKEIVNYLYKHIRGATFRNSDGLWLIPVKAKSMFLVQGMSDITIEFNIDLLVAFSSSNWY